MRLSRRNKREIFRAAEAVCERLESRTLLSVQPLHIVPQSHRPFTNFIIPAAGGSPTPPYTPAEIRKAYGLGNINFNGITGNGAGQTIALIEAFNDPNLYGDANKFSSMYGLPQYTLAGDGPTLKIVNEYGSTNNLPPDSAPGVWDAEDSLDVEWAHAIAPQANILVVEGNAYSYNNNAEFIDNETVALNTAKNTPGVSVVSMSFLVPLTSSETNTDPVFNSPSGQQGITFFAAAGDAGKPEGYPADSPNVVGVGGTSLFIDGDGTYGGETAWSGSGGGISPFEPQPVWQSQSAIHFTTTQRATPDVAWLADPNTGVVVLDTYYNPTPFNVGGTSLASPMWASLTSIVDQGRNLAGLPTLDGASQTLPLLYNLPATDFNDITDGSNGFLAGPGFDLVTGLGSPNVPSIVSDMVAAKFVYVDDGATGPVHDGSSWANAYTSFQPVLSTPPTGKQYVLVGQGTYLPGNTPSSTFQLQDNQTIIGGFAGFGAANPDASGAAYPTILSGNLGGGQHSLHVVTGNGTNSSAILIGLTITGGAGASSGGGLFDSSGSPTLIDCKFTSNAATIGAAMYNLNSSPTLFDCTFTSNTALDGGADFEDVGSTSSLTYCTFTSNIASNGGALYIGNASPTLNNCTFLTNSASASGGAVYDGSSASASLINCTFDGNTASTEGGGIANFATNGLIFGDAFVGNTAPLGGAISNDASSPTITNCTFNANSAGTVGGAIYDGDSSSPAITNCILWLDSAPTGNEIFNNDGASQPVVTYSDVNGGYAGDNNLNLDPAFIRNANPQTGDYGNPELQQFSLCINVGNNNAVPAYITIDAAGLARIVSEIVDLGAYESPSTLIYVDDSAPGPVHDGGSWATAFTNLQQALSIADVGFKILIAGGNYSPGGDAVDSFMLIDGVIIDGGYAGYGAPNPNLRNPSVYVTVLNGDGLNYHVVNGSGTDSSAVLDGVTVTGGNANGSSGDPYNLLAVGGYGDGGGIYMVDGSPTINNCVISGDSATQNGGGIYSAGYTAGSSPTITNCLIEGNFAYSGAGFYNGGTYAGGPVVVNCAFRNNQAYYYGGAITCGGLLNSSPPTFINCTVEGDSQMPDGNAIHGEVDYYGYSGNSMTLVNCVVYGDGPNPIGGNATITYSDIQGGFTGQGNINVDPKFVSSTNLQLQPTSPCINDGNTSALIAGDSTDIAGNPRVVDGVVDMGAYEAQLVDVNWTAAGDGINWSDSNNWSDKIVPTANDAVTISQGFTNVQASGDSFTAYSLSSQSPVEILGGSLTISQQGVFSNSALTIDSTGTLQIGTGNTAVSQVSLTGTIADNGSLKLNPLAAPASTGANFAANVSGNGTVTLDGSGTAFFQGNNTYFGSTIIGNSNALYMQTASSLPSGHTIINNGAFVIAAASTSANPVILGNLSGEGRLIIGKPNLIAYAKFANNTNTSTLASLTINAGSTLDITNNALQINFSSPATDPFATTKSELAAAYNNGLWTGTSSSGGVITSSTAQTQGGPARDVGVIDGNVDTGTAKNQIIIKYTLQGDANLNGLVNFNDLVAVVQNFNKPATDWAHGNFLYGPSTNFQDLVAIVQNFNKILTPAGSSSQKLGGTPLPLAAAPITVPVDSKPTVASNNDLSPATPPRPLSINSTDPDQEILDSGSASILTS